MITSDILRAVESERDAQNVCNDVRASSNFATFTKQFIYNDDYRVARNALWCLTKASNVELLELQPALNELIDLAINAQNSAVRRLSLNIIERLNITRDNLRSDFLDFCLTHATSATEFPGIQSLCIKLAYRMCTLYPELMNEFICTLEAMEIDLYKPAVRSIRKRILSKIDKHQFATHNS